MLQTTMLGVQNYNYTILLTYYSTSGLEKYSNNSFFNCWYFPICKP